MHTYRYSGSVMRFNTCVAYNWKGETTAPSEEKARSNLAYQFKKQNHLEPRTNVTLPEKIIKVD